MSHNPGRAARLRSATAADSTTTQRTFRPGQVVAAEATAFGNFDGVEQGTVQKADEFGHVVSRSAVSRESSQRCPSLIISQQLWVFF